MALLSPCTSPSSLLQRNFPFKVGDLRRHSPKFRRRITVSELQTSVGVSNRVGGGSVEIPTHKVTVHDRQRGVVHEFVVPEDQYILHTAESQNIALPFACRHGIALSSINDAYIFSLIANTRMLKWIHFVVVNVHPMFGGFKSMEMIKISPMSIIDTVEFYVIEFLYQMNY